MNELIETFDWAKVPRDDLRLPRSMSIPQK
jgi:hypothetical protein